jgi:hypothetical protein
MTIPPFPEEIRPSSNGPLGPLVRLGDIVPIEPVYIERPLLQAATFHLFAGKLGVGKGALIMRWLARCTNGAMYGRPRNALLLASEEDGPRDLVPRINVAEGDSNRVHLIPNNFLLPRDIEKMREFAEEIGDVGLIALDPLSNHIGGTNSNIDEEVRNALQPLAILAGDLDTLVIGIRHVSSKEAKGGFISRIIGSTAFAAVPRVVIGVAKDDEGVLHVRALKGNRLRYEDAGRRYRLESAPFLNWGATVVKAIEDGESMVDIDKLLEERKDTNSEKARQEIVRLIREEGGRMESDILDGRVAATTGVTARTVQKLRMELRDRGWIKHVPVDNADGTRDHWDVTLTSFAPYSPSVEAPDALLQNPVASGVSGSPQVHRNPDTPESTHTHSGAPGEGTEEPQETPANDQTRQVPLTPPSKPDFWEVRE